MAVAFAQGRKPAGEALHLGLPPHEGPDAARGRDPAPLAPLALDRRDEAIAAAVDRLDDLGPLGGVAQRDPQPAHALAEGGLADDGVTPDGVEEVVLVDQPAGLLQQPEQHPGHLLRQAHPFAVALEEQLVRAECDLVEAVDQRASRGGQRTDVGRV